MLTLTPEQRAEIALLDRLTEAIADAFTLADPKPAPYICQLAAQAALAVLLAATRDPSHDITPPAGSNGHKPVKTKAPKAGTGTMGKRWQIERVKCKTCGELIAAYRQGKHKCRTTDARAAA